jgi:ribonuclease G
MKQIIINCEQLQTRIAVSTEGRLDEYQVENRGEERIVGSIYKGRIRNLEASLQAAFVDIGMEKNAFLHYWDMVPATEEMLEMEGAADGSTDGDTNDESSEGTADDAHGGDQAPGNSPNRNNRSRNRNRRRDDRDQSDNRQDNDQNRGRSDMGRGKRDGRPPRSEGDRQSGGEHSRNDQQRSGRDDSRNSSQRGNRASRPRTGEVRGSSDRPAKSTGLIGRIKSLFSGGPATSAPLEKKQQKSQQQTTEEGGQSRNRRRRRGRRGGGERQSGGGERQSGGGERQSGGGERQSGGGERQSSGGERQSSGGERQSGGGERQSNTAESRQTARPDRRPRQQRRRPGDRDGDRAARDAAIAEIPKKFKVGSEVIVQVTKGMIGTKGPRVTSNLSLAGRYVVILPNSSHRGVSRKIDDRKERSRLRSILVGMDLPKNVGVICRTASAGLDEEALRMDIQIILDKWHAANKLRERGAPVCIYQEPGLLERAIRDLLSSDVDEIVVDDQTAYDQAVSFLDRLQHKDRTTVKLYDRPTPIFEHYKLTAQISGIFQRKVPLPSGAELCIDETEALIAIDINSGRSNKGKDHPETILNTNLEAAREVARQLRLRNIGGLVVVDFIDMRSREDRNAVYKVMEDCVESDRARTRLLPISRLGLLEMTRQREYASLQDSTFEACHYCSGKGLVKSSHTISAELQRRLRELLQRDKGTPHIRVTVSPIVLDRLRNHDSRILHEMEKQFGGNLTFRADPSMHQEEFQLTNVDTGKRV